MKKHKWIRDYMGMSDLTCGVCGVTWVIKTVSTDFTYIDAVGTRFTSKEERGCPAFVGNTTDVLVTVRDDVKGMKERLDTLELENLELRRAMREREERATALLAWITTQVQREPALLDDNVIDMIAEETRAAIPVTTDEP